MDPSAVRCGRHLACPCDREPIMSSVQPTKVRRAFVDDRANTRLGIVDSFDVDELRLTTLDGSSVTVRVADSAAVSAVIDEASATRHLGHRLVMVNEGYRLVGLAFGPPEPPAQLVVTAVVDLDDSSIPSDGDQPGWRLFNLLGPTDESHS